jgi:hypothetical protein
VTPSDAARRQATQAPTGGSALPPPAEDTYDSANAELALRWQQQLTWQPARRLGPLAGALSPGGSLTDFPDYIELAFGAVPGGRQDTRLWADLDLWAPDLGSAGVQPRVKLRALSLDSNVSRFSRSELSANLGLRSAF